MARRRVVVRSFMVVGGEEEGRIGRMKKKHQMAKKDERGMFAFALDAFFFSIMYFIYK